MPVVSVVVPVYNVENYLAHCLRSIRNQSLQDIEIICVNDGSNDSSTRILQLCEAVEPRLHVINKENGGLSSARNAGIESANGTYLMFVDSDDSLERNACEKVVQAFENNNSDIVVFGAHCYPIGQTSEWCVDCLTPDEADYNAFSIDILFKEKSRPFAFRTAIKTSFIKQNNLLFDETVRFGEDQVFLFSIFPRAQKTIFLSDQLYNYRASRRNSLMDEYNRKSMLKTVEHISVSDAILKDWRSMGLLEKHPVKMMCWAVEFSLFNIFEEELELQESLLLRFKNMINDNFSDIDFTNVPMSSNLRQMINSLLYKKNVTLKKRYMLKWEKELLEIGVMSLRRYDSSYRALRNLLRHFIPTPAKNIQFYFDELRASTTMNVWDSNQEQTALLLLFIEYQMKIERK